MALRVRSRSSARHGLYVEMEGDFFLFCINGNLRVARPGAGPVDLRDRPTSLVDGCKIAGSRNGLDFSTNDNRSDAAKFHRVIVQVCALQDLGQIGSQSLGITGAAVERVTVRGNVFTGVGMLAQGRAYRNTVADLGSLVKRNYPILTGDESRWMGRFKSPVIETALCHNSLRSGGQADDSIEQSPDFLIHGSRHVDPARFFFRQLALERLPPVGLRGSTAGIVPGPIRAVAQLRGWTVPGPQLDQGGDPRVQVQRPHVGVRPPELHLGDSLGLLEVLDVLLDAPAIERRLRDRLDARLRIGTPSTLPGAIVAV